MPGDREQPIQRELLAFDVVSRPRLPTETSNRVASRQVSYPVSAAADRHYRTLRRMLQVAVEKQKILANPCDRVEPPRVPKTEMMFLDWDRSIAWPRRTPHGIGR